MSSIADRWVAAPDNWPRSAGASVKAIVIHMAEGGGTVSWLTRDDGNSSHYVVEYTGRITQMVLESRAAGSIKPTLLRTSNDSPYTFLGETILYGIRVGKAVLGDGWSNPNSYVIAIEVEGYAAAGPNTAQHASLKRLIADIRSRHPGVPVLGHRDFQSYKACPGHKIRWIDYGGHGVPAASEEIMGLPLTLPSEIVKGRLVIPLGTIAQMVASGADYKVPIQAERPALVASVTGTGGGTGYLVDLNGDQLAFIRAAGQPVAGLKFTIDQPPAPLPVDCTPAIEAAVTKAVADTKASARVTFS